MLLLPVLEEMGVATSSTQLWGAGNTMDYSPDTPLVQIGRNSWEDAIAVAEKIGLWQYIWM